MTTCYNLIGFVAKSYRKLATIGDGLRDTCRELEIRFQSYQVVDLPSIFEQPTWTARATVLKAIRRELSI